MFTMGYILISTHRLASDYPVQSKFIIYFSILVKYIPLFTKCKVNGVLMFIIHLIMCPNGPPSTYFRHIHKNIPTHICTPLPHTYVAIHTHRYFLNSIADLLVLVLHLCSKFMRKISIFHPVCSSYYYILHIRPGYILNIPSFHPVCSSYAQ